MAFTMKCSKAGFGQRITISNVLSYCDIILDTVWTNGSLNFVVYPQFIFDDDALFVVKLYSRGMFCQVEKYAILKH